MSNKHWLALIVLVGLASATLLSDHVGIADEQQRSTSISNELLKQDDKNADIYSIEDGELISIIKARLFLTPETTGFNINVSSQNGNIVLDGSVMSAEERLTAERIVAQTDGVNSIENNIIIEPTPVS